MWGGHLSVQPGYTGIVHFMFMKNLQGYDWNVNTYLLLCRYLKLLSFLCIYFTLQLLTSIKIWLILLPSSLIQGFMMQWSVNLQIAFQKLFNTKIKAITFKYYGCGKRLGWREGTPFIVSSPPAFGLKVDYDPWSIHVFILDQWVEWSFHFWLGFGNTIHDFRPR